MIRRVADWWALFRGELGASIGRFVMPAAAVLQLVGTWVTAPPGNVAWRVLGAEIEAYVALAGPLWAGAAALEGRRDQVSGLRVIRSLGTRAPWVSSIRAPAAVSAFAVAANLLVWVVVGVRLAVAGWWGEFPVMQFIATCVSLCLYSLAGYLIGRVLPFYWAAALSVVTTFLVTIQWQDGGVGDEILAPVYLHSVSAWSASPTGLYEYRAAYGLLLCGVLFAAIAVRDTRSWQAMLCLAAAITGSFLVGRQATARIDTFSSDEPVPFEYNCSGERPAICLHPSMGSGGPAVREAIEPLARRLRGTPGELRLLEEVEYLGDEGPTFGSTPIALLDLSAESIEGVPWDIVDGPYGLDGCFENSGGASMLVQDRSALVSEYLVLGSAEPFLDELAQETDWINSLSEAEAREWLSQIWDAYTGCALKRADFE